MKTSPTILISCCTDQKGVEFEDCSLSVSLNYPRAIQAAGAVPALMATFPDRAHVAETVRRADGILLTGGDDIDPKRYVSKVAPALKKTVHPETPERDEFELMLIEEVFRQRKPMLCICRGHQMLNVALGGTLIIDIPLQVPDAIEHKRTDKKNQIVQEAAVTPGSLLARATGRLRLGINSTHHQAVGKLAKALRATAVTTDGIVEGLELTPAAAGKSPWLLGVQFHPERLSDRYMEHFELFKSFVQACRRSRRDRL